MKAGKKLIAMLLTLSILLGGISGISFGASAAVTKASIAPSYTSDGWYREMLGFTDSSTRYIEIADEGCDDIGSLHIYNTSPEGDMQVVIQKPMAAGDYTIKLKIKGTLTLTTEAFCFKEMYVDDTVFDIITQSKAYNDWTEITGTFTTDGGNYYGIFFSQYNWATDIYIDNLEVLDSSGNDMLDGMGSFCTEADDSGNTDTDTDTGTASDLLGIYNSETEDYWYRTWIGKVDTDQHYIEIAEDGCDDRGSLHIVNTSPDGDMRVGFKKALTAGTYTLNFKIKGSITYADQNFYFKESGQPDSSLVDLISQKSYSDWTEVSLSFTSAGGSIYGITVSQYNWATDIYIDNFKLLDSEGNDVLDGMGSFNRTSDTAQEEEPLPDNLLTLYDSYTANSWYRLWPAGDDTLIRYTEIAPKGCFDNGSLHIANVSPQGDMYTCINKTIPAGSYTIKLNVKGYVGLTTESFCFTEVGDTSYLFDIIQQKQYNDWTEVTGTFYTNGGTDYLIIFSQYNSVTDIYLDNIRIIDENGVDMLDGMGSFCTEPAIGEDTDVKIIPTLSGGNSSEISLTIPSGELIGAVTSEDGGIYLNGKSVDNITAKVTSNGVMTLDYTAAEGDVVSLDGIFTDNYYAKYIGPVAFRYSGGEWENLLSDKESEFYFFETLIENYGFNSDINGWEQNSLPTESTDTISLSSDGYEGSALNVTHNGSDGAATYKVRTSEYIPVDSGETYHLRLMVKATGNMKLGASLRGNGADTVADSVDCYSVIADGTDGWQWLNYTFTLPRDEALTGVKIQLDNVFFDTDAQILYDSIAFYREYPSGDANGDGNTDIKDLVRYKKTMADTAEFVSMNAADINSNSFVNVIDLATLKKQLLGNTSYGPEPYVSVISPSGVAYPYNDYAKGYLTTENANVSDYAVQMNDSAQDIIIGLECVSDSATFKVEYATKSDYSDAITVTTTDKRIAVNNLYKNTTYYVRVTATANGYTQTDECTFKTTNIGPRVMTVGGIYNMRDLGGYETSFGKTTIQGIAFRGTQPDKNGASLLTSQGDYILSDVIGVKLDIDLRSTSENSSIVESVIDTAEYVNYPISAYAGAFSESQKELYRQVFASYADVNNYPIYLHCVYGADRTGTVSYLLNALLGVSEEQLIEDYEYTSFSAVGLRSSTNDEMQAFLKSFNALEGDTPAEKAEAYMLSIGVTQDEIDTIRGIFFGEIAID